MGIRKPQSKVKRPHSGRPTKSRTLIVCGAQCSEKYYLENLLSHHSINTAGIKILDFAYTPERLVEEIIRITKAEKKNGELYDYIFCVVDRDAFEHFAAAKKRSQDHKFHYIESNPCFEYWLLIHFSKTDRPFTAVGGVSVGDSCRRELQKHYKQYAKNSRTVYSDLFDKLDGTIKYSERRYNQATAENDFNPSTNFHFLVNHLRSLT